MVEIPKELQISHTKINELAIVKSDKIFSILSFVLFGFVCFNSWSHYMHTLSSLTRVEPAPPAVDVQDCQASPSPFKDTVAGDKALKKLISAHAPQ